MRDLVKQRARLKRWHKSHPFYGTNASRTRKIEYVVKAGGRCVDCGFSDLDRPEVFDFDHRDPMTKHPKLRREGARLANIGLVHLSRVSGEAELAKCDLVCANCHRTRTSRRHHDD